MADVNNDRPASRAYHAASPSPRPSVGGRGSRSSLGQVQGRQEVPGHTPPAPPGYSPPHSPQQISGVVPLDQRPSLRPPASPFTPLFTLIASTSQSSNKQTIHHPTVHYIFADDDPEILTAALAHHHGAVYDDNDGADGLGTPDRGVLLDLEPTADGTGYDVTWASSLTADWAATSARLSRIEGGGDGVAAGLGNNLMLKIEGVSIEPSPKSFGKTPTSETEMQSLGTSVGWQQPAPLAEEYSELLQEFDKRMSTLRKVVEAGAARQRALEDGGVQSPEGAVGERAVAYSRSEAEPDDPQHNA